jgi:hypothetical protein
VEHLDSGFGLGCHIEDYTLVTVVRSACVSFATRSSRSRP